MQDIHQANAFFNLKDRVILPQCLYNLNIGQIGLSPFFLFNSLNENIETKIYIMKMYKIESKSKFKLHYHIDHLHNLLENLILKYINILY